MRSGLHQAEPTNGRNVPPRCNETGGPGAIHRVADGANSWRRCRGWQRRSVAAGQADLSRPNRARSPVKLNMTREKSGKGGWGRWLVSVSGWSRCEGDGLRWLPGGGVGQGRGARCDEETAAAVTTAGSAREARTCAPPRHSREPVTCGTPIPVFILVTCSLTGGRARPGRERPACPAPQGGG
jgi:hypothetical protein